MDQPTLLSYPAEAPRADHTESFSKPHTATAAGPWPPHPTQRQELPAPPGVCRPQGPCPKGQPQGRSLLLRAWPPTPALPRDRAGRCPSRRGAAAAFVLPGRLPTGVFSPASAAASASGNRGQLSGRRGAEQRGAPLRAAGHGGREPEAAAA